MKYLGIFVEDGFYLDGQKLKILMSHTDNEEEIIIRYDEEHPFLIKQIGIFLEESKFYSRKMYSLWEYEYFSEDDTECIAVAKHFANQISNFLKDTLRHFKDTEKIIDKRPTP